MLYLIMNMTIFLSKLKINTNGYLIFNDARLILSKEMIFLISLKSFRIW